MNIFIENLDFIGLHGVYDEERAEGRRFLVDLGVEMPDVTTTAHRDELARTLDYRRLAQCVLDVGQGPSVFLIEKMAVEILDRALALDDRIQRATITIRKAASGVPGDPQWVGVTLTRDRR